jgi:hypothetical protein
MPNPAEEPTQVLVRGSATNGAGYLSARWWMFTRNIITFLLGVAVIIDSLVEKNTATVGKLVVGLLLIGIPSMEDLLRLTKRRGVE